MEKKRIKLEEENEDLRQRLIESDLAKQVLQNEMDKLREVSSFFEGPLLKHFYLQFFSQGLTIQHHRKDHIVVRLRRSELFKAVQ